MMTFTGRCPTPGCGYAVHSNSAALVEQRITEHLATDARHTMRRWIDRDGNEQCGPRQAWN